jgi:hypothetical protein
VVKRAKAVAAAAVTISALAVVVPPAVHAATNSTSVTVPPVCLRLPLPNPFIPGAQTQIGYCP